MANVKLKTDLKIQGSLNAHENATGEATHDATWRDVIACWDAAENGSGINCTQADSVGKLIPTKAGTGKVRCFYNANCTVNKTFELRLAKNGVGLNREMHGNITASIPDQSGAIEWEGSWAANDEFTVQQVSSDGGSAFTMEYSQFVLDGLADAGV